MARCRDCGSEVAFPARYCTECGSYLPESAAGSRGGNSPDAQVRGRLASGPDAPFNPAPSTTSMPVPMPGAAPAPAPFRRSQKHARTLAGFALLDENSEASTERDRHDDGFADDGGAAPPTQPFHGGVVGRLGSIPDPPVQVIREAVDRRRDHPRLLPAAVRTIDVGPSPLEPDETEDFDPRPESLSHFFFYPNQVSSGPDEGAADPGLTLSPMGDGEPRVEEEAVLVRRRFHSRRRRRAVWGVAAAGLVVSAAIWLIARSTSSPTLQSAVHLDSKGGQTLTIVCETCPHVSSVSVAGATADFDAGKATVKPTGVVLPVGQTMLETVLRGADGSTVTTVPLAVTVAFQLAPSGMAPNSGIDPNAPVFRWLVQAMPGVEIRVDGQPVKMDALGSATHEVDLSAECSGPAASEISVTRTIHYVATRGEESVDQGDETLSAPIVRLEAAFTSEAGRGPLVSGRTLDGATVLIDGTPVEVRAGAFGRPLGKGSGKIKVVARLSGHLPRTIVLDRTETATAQTSSPGRIVPRRSPIVGRGPADPRRDPGGSQKEKAGEPEGAGGEPEEEHAVPTQAAGESSHGAAIGGGGAPGAVAPAPAPE